MHYSVSFPCFQKRKRKQSELNHGEVDSRAFHEKVGGVSFAYSELMQCVGIEIYVHRS